MSNGWFGLVTRSKIFWDCKKRKIYIYACFIIIIIIIIYEKVEFIQTEIGIQKGKLQSKKHL